MKDIPNMHPKVQPLLGFPSAWKPFRDFLHYGHPIHMQLHMFFASRNISFSPLSCPGVAFVPPFTFHFSVFTMPTPLCETHPGLGKLPFPGKFSQHLQCARTGKGTNDLKFPFLFRDLPLIQAFLT